MLLKSKDIAYMGVLLALNQLFIVLSSIVETNTILFFALASLIVSVVIIDFSFKNGVVFFIASCILGYFLSFNKIEFVSYILFFGVYSIIKYLIERYVIMLKHALIVEIILKILFFNIAVLILYFILKEFIVITLFWWMIPIAEIGFLLYDYAFTILIKYYVKNIKTLIRKNK